MDRYIYKSLVEWRSNSGRYPLLIRGARQIGKTFIVNQFGKKEFQNLITLNFERNPEYKDIFISFDPKEIVEKITLYTGEKIKEGRTLLFLDEIQDCPNAIMAMRYFYEEMPNLHIIGAGSLLEFALKTKGFRMPVGRIQYLFMFPMSFKEFITALGEQRLYDYFLKVADDEKIEDSLHEKLNTYVKKYFILGGMPAVIQEYIQTGDILKCQRIQRSILNTYQDDFAKYARQSKFKYLKKVFNAVSSMVGQKIIYSKIDQSIKSRDLKEALELLEMANIILRVKRTSGAGIPLKAGVKEQFFKIIFLDVGLLHAMNGIYSETIKEHDLTAIYKGAVSEQFVGQELLVYRDCYLKPALYYWVREAKSSNAELDYLIEKKEQIIPIEVKSGAKGHLKSMHLFLKKHLKTKGIKISQAPYQNDDKIQSIPFYGIEKYLKSIN